MEIFSHWQWAPKLGFEEQVERVKMGVLKRRLGAGWMRIDFHTREKKNYFKCNCSKQETVVFKLWLYFMVKHSIFSVSSEISLLL